VVVGPGATAFNVTFLPALQITDCEAEPTGIYLSRSGKTLFANIQHRGGDGQDLTLGIQRLSDVNFRTTSTAASQH